MNFNYVTPDGKLSLVYKGAPKSTVSPWKMVLASALPAAFMAPYMVPPEFLMYAYGAIFMPTVYGIRDSVKQGKLNRRDVAEVYLYESGEQLLLRTHCGVLHKLDILHNDSHYLDKNKDNSLVFVVENGGREYAINSQNAEVIDYKLLDKYVRAICIDTSRASGNYHHLTSRQTPANLRPTEFRKQVPNWSF